MVTDTARAAQARARLEAAARGGTLDPAQAALAGLASAIDVTQFRLPRPGRRCGAQTASGGGQARAGRRRRDRRRSTAPSRPSDAATMAATDAAVRAATDAAVSAAVDAATQAAVSAAVEAAHSAAHDAGGENAAGGHH